MTIEERLIIVEQELADLKAAQPMPYTKKQLTEAVVKAITDATRRGRIALRESYT